MYPAGKALELGFTISLAKLLLIEQQDWPIAALLHNQPENLQQISGRYDGIILQSSKCNGAAFFHVGGLIYFDMTSGGTKRHQVLSQ